jgi:hypothetical protein
LASHPSPEAPSARRLPDRPARSRAVGAIALA